MRSVLLISTLVASAAAPQPPSAVLRSPWTGVRLPAPTGAGYRCPDLVPPPRVITFDGYYKDARHSVVDPAAKRTYDAASASIEGYVRAIVRAADAFRTGGNREAAACALRLLSGASRAESLTRPQLSLGGSRQAFYVQAWMTCGAALAYLKVAPLASPADKTIIGEWLARLGTGVVAFQDRLAASLSVDSRNNLHAWAALAAAAAGVAADRRDLLEWGIKAGGDVLDQVDAEGFLPLELARGPRALHYHLFGTAPLVVLAEVAQANGVDLYARSGGALRRLVERVLNGLEDPSAFEKRTGEAQEPPDPHSGLTFSWLVAVERRFPGIRVSAKLGGAPAEGYFMLGGLPPP